MNKFSRIEHLTPYDTDYHQWSVEQAALLREGKLDRIDREHLAEEIESLGQSEKREIVKRLMLTILHLLKWQIQPEKRKGGWQASIRVQRKDLQDVLKDNPSLRAYPVEVLDKAYTKARIKAEKETGIPFESFPDECPFTIEQILDDGFLPE